VRTADLLFLPMHNISSGKRSRIVPAKTYEYMATGRPILAAVPNGDARDFVGQCGTGLMSRPDDSAAMAKILDDVYIAWKANRSIVHSNPGFVSQFDRQALTKRLATEFDSVLGARLCSQVGREILETS
jgi:glycosyltransferase involved in cell wall biosynthesis